jgi:peroxiredoxin
MRNARNYFSWCLVAGVLISAALCCPGVVAAAAQPKTLEIGAVAPDFSLPGVDDKTYTLADFKGANLLVIIFTCNHCPTAQAYEERIKHLAADYQDKGVAVVAIQPNDPTAVRLDELAYTDLSDSFEDMKTRAHDHEFNFPYLYDGETQATAKAYGPIATPHVFIFDKDRRLRFCGRIDDHENPTKTTTHDARDAIEALLADKPVPAAMTKTFGCSIKWADKKSGAAAAIKKWDGETADLQTIDADGLRELVANKGEKLRVINVWATWCGPCVTEFPELITILRTYRSRGVELVTVTADAPDNHDAALKFLNEQHASGANYIFDKDDPYALADAVGVEWQGALPLTLVVKPGGEVIYKKMGPVDALELRRAIVDEISPYYFKLEKTQ